MIRTEVAGYHEGLNGQKSVCLEPCCAEHFEGTCAAFTAPAGRCPALERLVLPLFPDLSDAYSRHLHFGETVQGHRCQWPGCGKRTAGVGPAAKYCRAHAALSERQSKRAYSRRYRERQKGSPGVEKLASATIANQGPAGSELGGPVSSRLGG